MQRILYTNLTNMLFLILLSSLFSCQKDPQIITKIVVETDTLLVTQHDTLFLTDTLSLSQFLQDSVTTFFLVRHAEKETTGTDPDLTPDGQARAEELQRVLKNIPLSAVYATIYKRTQHTAQPTATDQGLSVQIYDPLVYEPLTNNVLQNHRGHAVLVVGHTNTIPKLLNYLTGTNDFPADIPDSQFDNLYIVSVYEAGNATVLHLKYGVATP